VESKFERTDRIFFHVDVNSAFLSWEAVYRLKHLGAKVDLREVPSAIGGDITKRHGIILAKSIPAKKYNVKTAEPVTDALKKCPNLVLAPPNYELYEKNSKAFMEILRKYSSQVEKYSIDEAFMDVTESIGIYGEPIYLAHMIKDEIRDTLGFTVNIGVSDKKLLAKMASDFTKPDRVHTLFSDEIEKKMWPLPVGDLFFVGRSSEKKLTTLGINTIGDLANSDKNLIHSVLKKHGDVVWGFANGEDFEPVGPENEPNKGYGNSTTTPYDVKDADMAKKVLLALCETVGKRLRADNVYVKEVSVSLRFDDLSFTSHQKGLPFSTDITNEIYEAACELFDEMWDGRPLRHLGVRTSKVTDSMEARQLSLFDLMDQNNEGKSQTTDYVKQEKMDKAIDEIRKKFGKEAVMRGTFAMQDTVEAMTGGVSKERRTVDYSKLDIE